MKWIEIITLRSPTRINKQFVDELLKEVDESDTPKHLVEIRIYHHSVVETDLSIHIYWKSEPGSQHKSPLGLKFSYALRNLGLLNHSVWVETAALEIPSQLWELQIPGHPNSGYEKQYDSDRAKNRGEGEVLSVTEKQKNEIRRGEKKETESGLCK